MPSATIWNHILWRRKHYFSFPPLQFQRDHFTPVWSRAVVQYLKRIRARHIWTLTLSKERGRGQNASTISMVCQFWLWQFLNLSYITQVHNHSKLEHLLLLCSYHFCLYLPEIFSKKHNWFYFLKYIQTISLIYTTMILPT